MSNEITLILADLVQLLFFIYFGFKFAALLLRELIDWLSDWSNRRLTILLWSPLFTYMKGRD